jgi:hypothetical protein
MTVPYLQAKRYSFEPGPGLLWSVADVTPQLWHVPLKNVNHWREPAADLIIIKFIIHGFVFVEFKNLEIERIERFSLYNKT